MNIKKYSEFMNIIKLECERELKLSYNYSEKILKQLDLLVNALDEDDFHVNKETVILRSNLRYF